MRHVTRHHVGDRISLRRWLDESAGDVGDVIGHLVAWGDDDILHVRKRDETIVHVEASSILASRVVPPPPSRTR